MQNNPCRVIFLLDAMGLTCNKKLSPNGDLLFDMESDMDYVVFLGAYAMEPAIVKELETRGYHPVPSLVRYADDDMQSPSCCDWIIPGTAREDW